MTDLHVVTLALVATSAAQVAGCASTGVFPIGQDTYVLAQRGASCGYGPPAEVAADLYREANAFCAGQKKQLMPVKINYRAGIPFARCASAELQFRCTGLE